MKEATKRLLTKEVKLFERSIPVFLILIVALAGTGAAAVLASYGTVTGTATVDQSIVVDGASAPDQSGPTITTGYDADTVVAGADVTSQHNIHNNAGQTIDTAVGSSVVDSSDASVTSGVSTANVVYSQVKDNEDESDGYTITAEKVNAETNGDYAVRLTSEGQATEDYVKLWYAVGSQDVTTNEFKFDSFPGAGHDAGGMSDELFLVTSDGSVWSSHPRDPALTTSGDTVTIDLTAVSWNEGTPDLSNAEAVGLAYGDASATYGESVADSDEPTVNVTLDNVRVGSTVISERSDYNFRFLQSGPDTGDLGFGDYDVDYRYGLIQSAAFDVALVPDAYTVSTDIAPPS